MKNALLALAAACLSLPAARADEAVWTQLKAGGNVLLVRPAAGGDGANDPSGAKAGDCAAGHELSPAGREQARRLGRLLKFRAINLATPRSSRQCGALETARLVSGEEPEPWPLLDPPGSAAALLREVGALAAQVKPPYNAVLVTHEANIRALSGRSLQAGEILVMRARGGGLEVIGRIPLPPQ